MKHIYLFNESSRAAVYGVGTYIRQMTEALSEKKDYNLHIVNINSLKKEFIVEKNNNIQYYYIPSISHFNDNMIRYYRNSFFLIQPYIEKEKKSISDEFIFHFNFYQEYPLMEIIKENYPSSKLFFTVHYFNWCFAIKGNKSYFKTIISKPEDTITDITEKAILEEYKKERSIFQLSDKIICLAEFTRQLLIKDYNISPLKTSLIYNGLKDEAVILENSTKESLKKKLLITKNSKIILFVGRLDEIKGVDIVIRAFKKIVKKFKTAKLVIIGEGDFSKYLNECKDIWANVIFTGRIEKEILYKFYQIADMGIMPSTHEQCSYVAIEMLSHGIPLIASTTTGLNEMICKEYEYLKLEITENEKDVFVSSDLCYEKMAHILNLSIPERNKMTISLREHYLNTYNLKTMQKKILCAYKL